jgi:hypothetical protein
LQLAAIDEKSAVIVVRVRTALLDQLVDIPGGILVGLARTKGASLWQLSPFRICAIWHTKPLGGRGKRTAKTRCPHRIGPAHADEHTEQYWSSLAVDHSLREEHGAAFDRTGRFALAGMCVIGWGAGVVIAVPPFVSSLLLAFISGAVIMNSAIMELPSGKDGRFWPFVIGGLGYALLLIPLA